MQRNWQPGDRARIKRDAFGTSAEARDVAVRGQVGTLIEQMEDGLWFWRGDGGTENYPVTSELERIDDDNLC